jgi:RecJ-like exonuclease
MKEVLYDLQGLFNSLRPDPPNGFGAFDDDQLNERTEDMKECTECEGKGEFEYLSDCCGSERDADTGLCHHCHDHCGPSQCPDCNGTGIIN